jgi:hypothetical protein
MVLNVRPLHAAPSRRCPAMASGIWHATVASGPADLCDRRPKKRKSSCFPRTTRRDSCSRRAYPRTTATRNSRVRDRRTARAAHTEANGRRHPDSMDRAEWHRHGPQLPGARGLRQHMVRQHTLELLGRALIQSRDFVNEVQSRLQALAQGTLIDAAHQGRADFCR